MIPKHILLCTDGSEYNRGAIEATLFFSKTFHAQVHTLYNVDWGRLEGQLLVDLSASVGFEPFGNFYNQYKEHLRLLGHHILEYIGQLASEKGLPMESSIEEGYASAVIKKYSDEQDLVIAGIRGSNAEYHPNKMGHVAHDLLHKLTVPLLLVPDQFQTPKEIIVGFDASPSAFRAVEHGVYWSQSCSATLVIAHVNREVREGEKILKQAEDFLKPYNISFDSRLLVGREKEEILGLVDLETNPVLVLGRHGHSRIREWFLGTLTEYIAHRAYVPILSI